MTTWGKRMSANTEAKQAAMALAPGTNTAFGPLQQVDAGLLNIGYAEAGPSGGRAVVLLHGWPYDIHSFVDVVPTLAVAGYRVVLPHLRGDGTTRLLFGCTFRQAQQSAVSPLIIRHIDPLQ